MPALPSLGISEAERDLIWKLQSQSTRRKSEMALAEAYYLGAQVIDNLRIAVPKELEFLRVVVGWAALAVDPYVERHAVDCFRLADGTDADPYLTAMMAENGFDAELPLAITDALSMGSSYWSVGSPLESGGAPRITVESPLNTAVLWDTRGIEPRAVLQEYWQDERPYAALILPKQTTHLTADENGSWVIADRDEHGFDFVPVVRMANAPRTNNREGRSAITTALRTIIDTTCRTMLSLEVAREIYSVPQKLILGATEADFVKADGTPKSAFDTYITSILGLERDEDGNLPEITQMKVYDPSVFTKLVEMNAAQAASIVLATPQDIGLYTDGNPVSAEALNTAESRRNRRGRAQQRGYGPDLAKVAQFGVRFDNKGALPDKFRAIETDWVDLEEISIGVTSDAISKQITAGAVPATSDVTLKRLGYTAVERARLTRDRKTEDGRQAAKAIAASLTPPATEPPVTSDAPTGL